MRLPRILPLILLASAPICTSVLPAIAETSYTAAGIVFKQPGPYSQALLQEACGIHAGNSVTATDLGNAAQRLLDTGYFQDVSATVEGMQSAATVIFFTKLVDRSNMLRIGFENFVWLSQHEIETTLLAKSPLFAGYLPETSPLADTFDAALTEALARKGIKAKVTHDTVEPTMLRPERSIEFRISEPEIRVANIKLTGVSPELVPLIQKSVNASALTAYNEGLDGQTTADLVLKPLLDAGYVDASLSGIAVTPSIDGDKAPVVLSATLVPGDVYRVSAITFTGAQLLSPDAFAATEKLHPGDIASRELLLKTLEPLDMAYRRQGYMDVIVKAEPKKDAVTHQIAYSVTVTPGEQYRLHQVVANNLDPAAKTDFDQTFSMKSGDLFNPEYVQNFLRSHTALKALQGYAANYKAYADPNTHTVDLVLNFARVVGH